MGKFASFLFGALDPKKTVKKAAIAAVAFGAAKVAGSKLPDYGIAVNVDPDVAGAALAGGLYAARDFLRHRWGWKWLP